MYNFVELFLQITISLLVGMIIVLNLQNISYLRRQGKLSFNFSSGMIIAITSSGCPSCGLSLISFFAPAFSLSILPLTGIFLQILTIVILFLSLVYLLKRKNKQLMKCNLK